MTEAEKVAAITAETIAEWKMRERAHYNGGKEWFGYGYQCVENPRLYRIDRYKKATRSVESEWQVDGAKCADIAECAARLNSPPLLTDDEFAMLNVVQPGFVSRAELKRIEAYASFDDPMHILHYLDRKGCIEWQSGSVRLTELGDNLRAPATAVRDILRAKEADRGEG